MHKSIISNGQEISPDEGTHLLVNSSSTAPTPEVNDDVRQHAQNILLSTTLSRLGSRSWEFASPLLLLEWSPGSLLVPAIFGLAKCLFRTIVFPHLGKKADGWDRFTTVLIGLGAQGFGCLVSIAALMLWNNVSPASTYYYWGHACSLSLVILAGVIEALGASLSSVAVKKEWVPIVFDELNKEDDSNQTSSSLFRCIPVTINLSFINTTMTNIDLCCAMSGPILAGWLLQLLAKAGDRAAVGTDSMQAGFLAIALINVISFVPEALLLRRVYLSCPPLQQRNGSTSSSGIAELDNNDKLNPWSMWFNHPSGLPILSMSLASLYLTALSPSGVVLTAYLVTTGLSPSNIGVFRAVGALSGVAGISLFSFARHRGNGKITSSSGFNKAEARIVPAQSIDQLRAVTLSFLILEIVSVVVAAVAFSLCQTTSPSQDNSLNPPWQMTLFLSAICVSRAGLYSFDIGALEIEQYIVDERYRNAVGSVEDALCSLAEMGMYVLSIGFSNPSQFGIQVCVSAMAVTFGGCCFAAFIYLYLNHGHYHIEQESHAHQHSHSHHHHHTSQQERDLQNGYHIHLHRHHSNYC